MRLFTVTLKVAIHEPEEPVKVSALDLIEDAILMGCPEIQVLEGCEHEQALVDKEVWEDLQSTSLFADGIYLGEDEHDFVYYNSVQPAHTHPTDKVGAEVPAGVGVEEREDIIQALINDHLESQGDEIADRETRPN